MLEIFFSQVEISFNLFFFSRKASWNFFFLEKGLRNFFPRFSPPPPINNGRPLKLMEMTIFFVRPYGFPWVPLASLISSPCNSIRSIMYSRVVFHRFSPLPSPSPAPAWAAAAPGCAGACWGPVERAGLPGGVPAALRSRQPRIHVFSFLNKPLSISVRLHIFCIPLVLGLSWIETGQSRSKQQVLLFRKIERTSI